MGILIPDSIITLLKKVSCAPRFKDLALTKYINKINYENPQQFSAVTTLLGDGSFHIAFRGTDDTIVGWKEDFNMGFMSAVPSQLDAVKYVNSVADEIDRKNNYRRSFKGGNLRISAVYCSDNIKNRIITVYNNDGPGFSKKMLEFRRICGSIG